VRRVRIETDMVRRRTTRRRCQLREFAHHARIGNRPYWHELDASRMPEVRPLSQSKVMSSRGMGRQDKPDRTLGSR
jgi:hypothetical protein